MAVAPAHAEALQRLGAEVVDPFADGLVPAHATQGRGAGERQHRGQRMAPALAAAGVVDAVEERGQGTHLGGAEHHLRGSMAQVRVEMHRTQPGPRGARQRVDEHPLRARVFAVAVAPALAAKAAGPPDLDPVRGSVDGAVETRRVDEGLDEQQRMAEAHRPITHETARAQRQHSRAEVARSAGQEQEPGVVGEQMQPVKLHRVVPANPAVARRALQRRCREHHQRQPLAAMMSDIAHRLADSGQRTEVVVRLHQLPKPSLLVRCDDVDPNLRESHHHVHAPTRASRHSYPNTGSKFSIAGNSLLDRAKAQSIDPPWPTSYADTVPTS